MKRAKLKWYTGWLICLLAMPLSLFANEPLIDLAAELEAHMAQQQDQQTEAPVVEEAAAIEPQESMVEAPEPPAVITPPVKPEPAKWGYAGELAPRLWHRLDPNYLSCATGQIQSPINLAQGVAVNAPSMPGIDIVYRPVPLRLIQDHQGLRGDYPLGSYIRLDQQRYEFTHYRFRTPSEHHLEGFAYPMEIQLFHRDGEGRQLIISVLVQEGRAHPSLATILSHLPKEKDTLNLVEDLNFNPVRFLPDNKNFYRYLGSLTTPPCTEGVVWIVFKQPIDASIRQLLTFHQLIGDNSRPIQALNGRLPLKSWSGDGARASSNRPSIPGYYFDF
ncbi:carbonic anhydrase family protein [Thiomicrospira microaerophila]|uniref:carbonic anhydrase n=1 Tax=Thiomicrospira microaerophila TaxID=406020 RepID=UPI00200CA26F|nr:carbonic anhydrase family protein [Thiomicrospira microaerophila]UQB42954.1 carbonic anhydrase family protein [Thiomicrospira microaerophila]